MTGRPSDFVLTETKRRQTTAADNHSIDSESVYTQGTDEWHTDDNMDFSVISNGGFTDIEINIQKATTGVTSCAAAKEAPAKLHLSLYDDIERQISAKAGLGDDWDIEDTFEAPEQKQATASVLSDTSEGTDDEESGLESSMTHFSDAWNNLTSIKTRTTPRRCKISLVLLVALATGIILIVYFAVLPGIESNSNKQNPTASTSSTSDGPVPSSPDVTTEQVAPIRGDTVNNHHEASGSEAENDKEETVDPPYPADGKDDNTVGVEASWIGIVAGTLSECQDTDKEFFLDNIPRTCAHLVDSKAAYIVACRPEGAAWEVCKRTCNNCPKKV